MYSTLNIFLEIQFKGKETNKEARSALVYYTGIFILKVERTCIKP